MAQFDLIEAVRKAYGIDSSIAAHAALATAHPVATTSVNGFMSSVDKTKLDTYPAKNPGLGGRQGSAQMGHAFTEDGLRDFNTLITAGEFSVDGSWMNGTTNVATGVTHTGIVTVEVRQYSSGIAYLQQFKSITGESVHTQERAGTGTYPSITWQRWTPIHGYQIETEYRISINRPGITTYPYHTLLKRDPNTDATQNYTTGAFDFRLGPATDLNNPGSGKYVAGFSQESDSTHTYGGLLLRARNINSGSDLIWMRLENAGMTVRHGGKDLVYNTGVLTSGTSVVAPLLTISSTQDNAVTSATRKDYVDAQIGLQVAKAGDTMTGQLVMGTGGSIKLNSTVVYGANNANSIMRDHGNGNVTLSASRTSADVAGDLYIGYNATGFYTKAVQLYATMNWKGGQTIVDANGKIPGTALQEPSTKLTGPIDFNQLTATAVYTLSGANNASSVGYPPFSFGTLEVTGAAIGTGTYSFVTQLATDKATGIQYTRVKNDDVSNTWTAWKKNYSEAAKPTAADVGALATGSYNPRADSMNNTDGTITTWAGDLNTLTMGTYKLVGKSGSTNYPADASNYLYVETKSIYSNALQQTAEPYDGGGAIWHRNYSVNSSSWTPWVKMYDTDNKPTAADVGAVPTTDVSAGGTYASVLNKIPKVQTNGALKIARYVDFHTTDSVADYDIRFDCASSTQLNISGGNVTIGNGGLTAYAISGQAGQNGWLSNFTSTSGSVGMCSGSIASGGDQRSGMGANVNGNLYFWTKLAANGYALILDETYAIFNREISLRSVTQDAQNNCGVVGAAKGGGFANQWTRSAPFRAVATHSGSSYAPALQVLYTTDGSWNGMWSVGHLRTTANTGGAFCIHHINAAGGEGQIYQFQSNGSFGCPGTGSFTDVYISSDRRQKSNFAPITNALEKVQKLTGQSYDKAGNREVGLIAQDVQAVQPESVHENTEGFLSIAPAGVTALLVEALKELTTEVRALRARVEELEANN